MLRLAILLSLLTFPAVAQPAAPDPVQLQKALSVVQQQRNNAMDQIAALQLEVYRLTEELEKLKKEKVDVK